MKVCATGPSANSAPKKIWRGVDLRDARIHDARMCRGANERSDVQQVQVVLAVA